VNFTGKNAAHIVLLETIAPHQSGKNYNHFPETKWRKKKASNIARRSLRAEKYGIYCLGRGKFASKYGGVGLIWIGYTCGRFSMIAGKSFRSSPTPYITERFTILEE